MRAANFPLLTAVKFILRVQPDVHHFLGTWEQLAETIPDADLQKQALMSIETKAFHGEGGAIYALLVVAITMKCFALLSPIRPLVIIWITYATAVLL